MISSLMCAVGLAACCGLCCLKDQPQIKRAISESVGNNQVTTPVTYDGFIIDENYENNFVLVNFDSPSAISQYSDYFDYGLAFGEAVEVEYDGNIFYDVLANAELEGNRNVDMVLLSTYRYTTSYCYLYVSAFINTEYASSLSSDGVNAYFDIYTQNFNIDLTNSEYYIYSFDTTFFDYGDMPSAFPYINNYYSYQLSGYDPVGADYNFSPIAYDTQYEYYASESDAYVTGHRLGFSFSYPNVNTNGVESYAGRDFLWNYKSYCIKVTNDLTIPTSPFGDSVYCSFSMAGLESQSSSAYNLGYQSGYTDGYDEGSQVSTLDAYQSGYHAGFNAGTQTNFSWNGLFGAVADTPITMLRGMFNFDLFGMNVLSVVLTLLVSIIVIRIVVKVLF